MFSQDEIDAVLNDAQSAVSELASKVNDLVATDDHSEEHTPAADSVAVAPSPPPPTAPARLPPDRIRRILKLKVPLVVRLAERSMLLSEIMKLMPGTILEFPRTVDEELDLLVNNHQIGHGVAVKVNERFGLRVTYIGDIKRRLSSLTAS
ncbi:MAG TPA: FliM/FliN family flagellar motor C-terminal domain-containing protein [Phycisphaerae bacterium]|nr:FliM/FliN family flagellar motor C-terminal domain-containing protein [Phycisphaerae bacterium]